MRLKAFFFILLILLSPAWADDSPWAIAIHGGAGISSADLTEEQNMALHRDLEKALKRGRDILSNGGTALDCVEQVVAVLEDAPSFNAGKGAVLNAQGKHELDASIMDGRDLSCGAVAGVTTVKNPVQLARLVMEKTRHVLLATDGAEAFAQEMGVERVPNDYFTTPRRLRDWQERRGYNKGTVGCVALDTWGNLAAATSTGGLTNKKWGRIGDSPIVGAGCYANNESCAFSGTGTGEEYIRRSLGHDVSARMIYGGDSLEEAARGALESLPEDTGGMICVDGEGHLVLIFNTPGMARGSADWKGRFQVGIDRP